GAQLGGRPGVLGPPLLAARAGQEAAVPVPFVLPAELCPEGGVDPDGAEPVLLAVDSVLDRFGARDGRVLSADGTPFTQRGLPPEMLDRGYHRYRVLRELPAWRTVAAPWFGQAGGGVRFRTTHAVAELVALGFLAELGEDGTR
ncbi:TNT domain-containing protein, partial [Crossiella equi]|uniref:TNT domain-containing protein n=1 Tax=Crossiella equi TaxID=130796 RepID=UPI001177EE54